MPPKDKKVAKPAAPAVAKKEEAKPEPKAKAEEDKKRKAEQPPAEAEEPPAKEAKDEFAEEEDAKPDKRPAVKSEADFLTPDLTLDALPCMGNKVLMSINEGGLQYMISGARANIGLKAGRYMYEFKIVETYHTTETYQSRLKSTRQIVRVGFSTSGSSLTLGESETAVYFDNEGNYCTGKSKVPRVVQKFGRDQGMAVVLNLDPKSPHANTISLFKEGVRACKPQKLPESLIGKPLFPHISYRHMSVMVNFGKKSVTKMPFQCRMVNEAATADCQVETPPKDGKCEVIVPVAFPDEGTFDWLDSFLEEKPNYLELSDRKISDWAVTSGLPRPKMAPAASNDKPYYIYQLPSMDDMSTQKVVSMLAPMQPRNYVVMEVKSNLVKEERAQILKRFPSTHFKKVAYVVMGEPNEAYKKRVRNKILKMKQDKADSTWRIKKAQQEQKKKMLQRQKELVAKQKEAEDAKKKMEEEEKKAKAAEGEGEEEDKPKEAQDETTKPDEEMKPKEAEPAPEEEEEDLGDEPPKVELTEEEENLSFLPKGPVPDLAPSILSKAFANFTIPEKEEGFDEIKFIWQKEPASKEYLRKWVLETKLTTRIEDLQPSQDFKDKFAAWQKSYSELQGKQKAWRAAGSKKSKEGSAPDIFSVEDINDIGGGEPLYSSFEAEDWALLQLRWEMYLLQDSFKKDVNDADRVAIPEAHVGFYYGKYFKKQINTKQFGVTEVADLVKLVKDTVAISEDTKMFATILEEEVESLDMFVKLTEDSRKERQRRIDAGDETARLKFVLHNPAPAPVNPAPGPAMSALGAVPAMPGPKGKGKGKKGKW
mmetsp:Transcript_43048/g.77141  ORF Transcript_43048/g.77141 Transcript_43048/m.77141 type:complete len:822 (-) Transcript_43048:111-2576(-)